MPEIMPFAAIILELKVIILAVWEVWVGFGCMSGWSPQLAAGVYSTQGMQHVLVPRD